MIGPRGLNPIAQEILRHTLDDRPELAAALLDVVTEHGDSSDMYGVCVVASETGRQAMHALYFDTGTPVGEQVAPAEGLDEHRLFARQFLAAQVGKDAVQSVALFEAAESPGTAALTESVCALLAHVRDLVRRAEHGPVPQVRGAAV